MITNTELLLKSLRKFYDTENIEKIIPIINGSGKVSLRLIDWFVTNYSKKHNVVITKNAPNGKSEYFNVYLSYHAQLRAFSKKFFDPFRRNKRIMYCYDKNKECIETTVAQLAFFRWALENDILNFIMDENNMKSIENDMNTVQKNNKIKKEILKKEKDKKVSRINMKTKRNVLSNNSVKKMTTYNSKTSLSFE